MACLAETAAATSTGNARVTNGKPLQVLQKQQQSLVATTMKRVIASTQLDEKGNLAWITAGH
jgi:hypothetical protein